MSDSDLEVAAFGEGIPRQSGQHHVPAKYNVQGSIAVYMRDVKTKMPFGLVETGPFLELLWRKTGADCDGEEAYMEFPWGRTYRITLKDERGDRSLRGSQNK